MSDFEVGIFLKGGQLKVPNTPRSSPYCFVECDDSVMDGGVGDGEKVDDVFSVAREFCMSVREGEGDCSDSSVPSDRPVSSVLDGLHGLNRSKSDFEVAEFLCFEVVIGGRELPSEYCIQVDCLSRDDILPFRVWKLGAIGLVNERTFRCFWVDCVHIEEFESFGEVL